MEKKIVNLDNFRAKKSNYNVIESFNLGAMSLVLDPSIQIQLMKNHAMAMMNADSSQTQQVDSLAASYLLSIADFLYHGIFTPFNMPFNFIIRREKETNRMSLLGLCNNLDEISRVMDEGLPRTSMREYLELEIEESLVKPGTYKESLLYTDDLPVLVDNPLNVQNSQAATLLFKRVTELVKNYQGKIYRSGDVYIAFLGETVAKNIQICIRSTQFAQ